MFGTRPENMTDLSDAEWLKALRLEYGDDHICLYRPPGASPGALRLNGKPLV